MDDEDEDDAEDEDEDEAFDDGDVLGREVGRRWEGGRVSDVCDHNAGGGGGRGDGRRRAAQIF